MVETVFCISLVAVVLMLIFNLFPTSSIAVHRARQQLQASTMAQSQMEALRSHSFQEFKAGKLAPLKSRVEGVDYTLSSEVYAIPGEDPGRLLGLRATASWSDQGRLHEVSQEAYYARIPR